MRWFSGVIDGSSAPHFGSQLTLPNPCALHPAALALQPQPQGSGGSAGTHPLRHSLSASTGAQPLAAAALAAGALAATAIASTTPMPADSHLRHSLGSLDKQGGTSGPTSATQSSSHASGSSGSGQGAPAAPALDASHLSADSPAVATAATSMMVHPMLSAQPSISQLSLPSTVGAAQWPGDAKLQGVLAPVRRWGG